MTSSGDLGRTGDDVSLTADRGVAGRLTAGLARQLAAERGRWVLWLPVAFGAGIALYFWLPEEPTAVLGPLGVLAAMAGGYLLRQRPGLQIVAFAAGALALGFAVAQWHADRAGAPVLAKRLGPVAITGEVRDRSAPGDGGRVILHRLEIPGLAPEAIPDRVRLSVAGGVPDGIEAGDRVRLRAVLQPPPRPAAPGAFDFARQAYFQRIGAVGYAVSAVTPVGEHGAPAATGWSPGAALAAWQAAWSRWRQAVARRVLGALPGPTGGIAAALMTG